MGRYTPRGSELQVFIRHRSGDLYILEEAFGERMFVWPPEVAERLGKRSTLTVLDLGAHIGFFSAATLAQHADAEITAFEPDEDNRRLLEMMVDTNRLSSRIRVVPACAAARDGTVAFASGSGSTSHIVYEPGAANVQSVPAEDVLPLMARSDLVKIDIEGGEWSLLRDARFGSGETAAMLLEYHPGQGVTDGREEALEALTRAGFETGYLDYPGSGVGMFWGWR